MFVNSLVAEKTFPHTSQFQGTHLQRIGVFLTALSTLKKKLKLRLGEMYVESMFIETWKLDDTLK